MSDVPGSGRDDVLTGTSGDDLITGRGGDDILRAGGGDDTLRGGLGDDRALGGLGDDLLIVDVGDDILIGGSGFDTASSRSMAVPVIVELETDRATIAGPGLGLDSLMGIEVIVTGAEADTVRVGAFPLEQDVQVDLGEGQDMLDAGAARAAVSVEFQDGGGATRAAVRVGDDSGAVLARGLNLVQGSPQDDVVRVGAVPMTQDVQVDLGEGQDVLDAGQARARVSVEFQDDGTGTARAAVRVGDDSGAVLARGLNLVQGSVQGDVVRVGAVPLNQDVFIDLGEGEDRLDAGPAGAPMSLEFQDDGTGTTRAAVRVGDDGGAVLARGLNLVQGSAQGDVVRVGAAPVQQDIQVDLGAGEDRLDASLARGPMSVELQDDGTGTARAAVRVGDDSGTVLARGLNLVQGSAQGDLVRVGAVPVAQDLAIDLGEGQDMLDASQARARVLVEFQEDGADAAGTPTPVELQNNGAGTTQVAVRIGDDGGAVLARDLDLIQASAQADLVRLGGAPVQQDVFVDLGEGQDRLDARAAQAPMQVEFQDDGTGAAQVAVRIGDDSGAVLARDLDLIQGSAQADMVQVGAVPLSQDVFVELGEGQDRLDARAAPAPMLVEFRDDGTGAAQVAVRIGDDGGEVLARDLNLIQASAQADLVRVGAVPLEQDVFFDLGEGQDRLDAGVATAPMSVEFRDDGTGMTQIAVRVGDDSGAVLARDLDLIQASAQADLVRVGAVPLSQDVFVDLGEGEDRLDAGLARAPMSLEFQDDGTGTARAAVRVGDDSGAVLARGLNLVQGSAQGDLVRVGAVPLAQDVFVDLGEGEDRLDAGLARAPMSVEFQDDGTGAARAAVRVGDDSGAVLARGLNLVQGSAQADLVRVGAVPLDQDLFVDLGEGEDRLDAGLAGAPMSVEFQDDGTGTARAAVRIGGESGAVLARGLNLVQGSAQADLVRVGAVPLEQDVFFDLGEGEDRLDAGLARAPMSVEFQDDGTGAARAAVRVGDDSGAVLARGLNLVQGSAQADLVRVGAVPLEQDVLVDLGGGQDMLDAGLARAPMSIEFQEDGTGTARAAVRVGGDSGAVLARGLNLVQGSAQGDLIRVGAAPVDQDLLIDLGEGQDRLDASQARAPVLVDLPQGIVRARADAIFQVRDVEIVEGGEFSDTLIGDDASNALRGNGGDDVLDGGLGIDTALFAGSRGDYSVTAEDGVLVVAGPDGEDRLTAIEFLEFDDATLPFEESGASIAAQGSAEPAGGEAFVFDAARVEESVAPPSEFSA